MSTTTTTNPFRTRHTPGCYVVTDGTTKIRYTYELGDFDSQRAAHQLAIAAAIAEAVAESRGVVEHGRAELVAALAEPADVRDAAADLRPEPVAPIMPTMAQLDEALAAREDAATKAMWACKAGEDTEGAKIAKNSANAYRKARAMALRPDGTIRQAPNGDLLVRSSERSSQWHTVNRQPREGSDYSPITCSCEYGQTVGKLGICWHYAAYEGWYDAIELAVAESDAETEARELLAA
jgi:hypothetical protein